MFGADCSGNKTAAPEVVVPKEALTCDPVSGATACSTVRITGTFVDDPSLECRFREKKVC